MHGPVAAGDDDSVLSGEGVGGQALDVPVPHHGGSGQEAGETEARGAWHLQLTHLGEGGGEKKWGGDRGKK